MSIITLESFVLSITKSTFKIAKKGEEQKDININEERPENKKRNNRMT